jgi:mannose-6-phosphate isomerase
MIYPLRFRPLFRRYLWGGRRLYSVLNKPIGAGDDFAESWEIVDRGEDQSVVSNGPRAGQSLHALVLDMKAQLLGERWASRIDRNDRPASLRNRFPLLLKFLDARLPLSVQVHPNDQLASRLEPPDLGKTEAWYVLASGTPSRIYAGLRRGVSREALAAAIESGQVESTLHSFPPRPGDCVFIPAGTVHAIGGEILLCEIQQASDTTFRLFDWNRLDSAGKPRDLHVSQALEAIDFQRGPVEPIRRSAGDRSGENTLIECDQFVMVRRSVREPVEIAGDGRMRILVTVDGTVRLDHNGSSESLAVGQCALLPAAIGPCQLQAGEPAAFLEIRLPD